MMTNHQTLSDRRFCMSENSFDNYGYNKETYQDCKDLIVSTNRKHIIILISWFLTVNVFYLIFCILNLFGFTNTHTYFYAIYVTLAFLLELWLLFFSIASNQHNCFFLYIATVVMLYYGIIESILRPYMPATMYHILLILCAVSFIDKMIRMSMLLIISTITFIFTSFTFKTFSIAYHDTYSASIVIILSIGLHYTFQRTRITQFVLYKKDLHIQKELQIKSSFDSLTSLLNRGKFFSIAEEILRRKDDDYKVLCLLDLDGFKQINDQLGHQTGDKAIQITGKTILQTLGTEDFDKWSYPERIIREKLSFAGRLGGDEFIIFIRGKNNQSEIKKLLSTLLHNMNEINLYELNGLHASFGFTELTSSDTDIDNAYKRADEALYISKRSGKNQINSAENTSKDSCNI